MDRIVNMIARRFVMRAVGKGIDTGMARMSRGRTADGRPADLTPKQRAHVGSNQRTTRQVMKLARRFGRF